MSCWEEPTLKELLSEQIITALMDADGVNPEELETCFGGQHFEAVQPRQEEISHQDFAALQFVSLWHKADKSSCLQFVRFLG